MNASTRRKFITDTAKAGIGTIIAAPAIGALLSASGGIDKFSPLKVNTSSFDQDPLPYTFNALEPHIDASTMEIHYSKHAATYCKNLKEAVLAEKVDTKKSLENIITNISTYSVKMRNNAGGHYNHQLFWKCLSPVAQATPPSGNLLKAINKNFGSVDEMKAKFSEAAKTRFGSGWAWLILDKNQKLSICSTANQDNPLMDLPDTQGTISETKGFPLLALDVWEHAYYLKYQNKRADYIDNFWKIVNWSYVTKRFESI